MTRTWPTTCTVCRAPFDAGFFVVSDQEIRLCPECEECAQFTRELLAMCQLLEKIEEGKALCKAAIAAHKAAHPPLVVTGQGEYRKENHG